MAFSRSSRIIALLVIDTLFFFLEIIVGYAVHSLALVADSFHMLNDVLSLVVALWAIKLAKNKQSCSKYTYGWQRAEVLGALINGVFLLALCVSIVLEAIQRFFDPPEISNPVLILIVGCAGLASNLLGLVLVHDHSHGHGHSHGPAPPAEIHIEEGQPDLETGGASSNINKHLRKVSSTSNPLGRSRSRSISKHRHFSSVDDIQIHPASLRASISQVAKAGWGSSSASEYGESDDDETAVGNGPSAANENSPLVSSDNKSKHKTNHIHDAPHHHPHKHVHAENLSSPSEDPSWHKDHVHNQPPSGKKKSGGHSHENLNMRGVFLHVLGDALGNVGVIGAALFIWLTDFTWRFYVDPAISLVITIIIFSSALPLCQSAASILLQGVPKGISLDDVKRDIEDIPGVLSVHELHIWQLSDVKMVASLHVQITFNPHCPDSPPSSHSNTSQDPTGKYIALAKAIRTCLHAYGIHSSTIQPEYTPSYPHSEVGCVTPRDGVASPSEGGGTYGSLTHTDGTGDAIVPRNSCLMECSGDCATGTCCGPADSNAASMGHGHGHHGHSH